MRRCSAVFLYVACSLAWIVGCAPHARYHDHPLPDPASYNAHFGDMDADGNDAVSVQEFTAYFPESKPQVFEALDLNRDGVIDHDEWHRFKEAHGLKHVE